MKNQVKNMILMALLVFLSACYEDDSCSQNTVSGINVTVSNSGSDSSSDLDELDQDNVESWRFTALDDTVSLVNSESQTYTSGIPLDMNDTSITILFNIRDNDSTAFLKDTIVINYYQTDLQLLSVNCGFAPLFRITGGASTAHVLDSIVVNDVEISTDLLIDNVAFYY